MGKAICKTCGGILGTHQPSVLDKDGVGHPDHAMGPGFFTPMDLAPGEIPMSNKIEEQAELSHLDEPRRTLKWCYDHGILKGEFPESGNDRTEILDMAERRLNHILAELLAKQKEKWEKEHEQSKLHAELLGVSHSNDAFHDLSAPTLQMWFSNEMKDLEERITHLSSKEQKGTQ